MLSNYLMFKFAHVLGVVVLIGNVTVTAVWKLFADRTHDPSIVIFAQRLVVGTDYAFTLGGIGLIIVGGYGMAWAGHIGLLTGWVAWGQAMFVISGVIWGGMLLPIQAAQSALARNFDRLEGIPERYWQLSRRWLVLGILATVPLIAAMYFMIAKP